MRNKNDEWYSKFIRKERTDHELGTFEVITPTLRISDPCYDKGTWCAGTVENAKLGTWKAQVLKHVHVYTYPNHSNPRLREEQHSYRNVLIAVHESFDKSNVVIERAKIDGGIDAGMAGIFDDSMYQVNYDEDYIMYGNEEYNNNNLNYRRQEMKQLLGDDYKERTQEEDDKMMLNLLKGQLLYLPKNIEENKGRKGFEQFAERDARRLEEIKVRIARYEANPIHENIVERTRDWYEVCCDKSLSNMRAGVIRNGVVSSSGYGDGGYSVYVAKDKTTGQVVGVKLVF